MDSQTSAAISASMLFHILGVLALATAIKSAIQEYQYSHSIEDDTREILFLSPIMITIFTVPILLIAGDEIVSVLTVMSIIDIIACLLGVKIGSSH